MKVAAVFVFFLLVGSGLGCTSEQKRLACQLLSSSNVILASAHASGKGDNAYASTNLRDMCKGAEAKRSSYCPQCPPGGSVCISTSVLNYLLELASTGNIKVNELAGGCHSCNSKHYQGLAVDLDNGSRDDDYISKCRSKGGFALHEGSHVHCQFNG